MVRVRSIPSRPPRDVRATLKNLTPVLGHLLKLGARESNVTLRLPSTRSALQSSSTILRDEETPVGKLVLAAWHADALCAAPGTALEFLAGPLSAEEPPTGIKVDADLRYWQSVELMRIGKVQTEGSDGNVVFGAKKSGTRYINGEAKKMPEW